MIEQTTGQTHAFLVRVSTYSGTEIYVRHLWGDAVASREACLHTKRRRHQLLYKNKKLQPSLVFFLGRPTTATCGKTG